MRFAALLVCCGLIACGGSAVSTNSKSVGSDSSGSSASDASMAAQAGEGGSAAPRCGYDASLGGAGPGACAVGRAYLECHSDTLGCGCITDDPTTCEGCGPATGATCTSQCAANEYAVSCGGPPGNPEHGIDYQGMPAKCRALSSTPAGSTFACCPCQ